MQKLKYLFVTSVDLLAGGLERLSEGKADWTLWYFGEAYSSFLEIQNRIPSTWKIAPVGQKLSEVVGGLVTGLINIEDGQIPDVQDRLWWDASDLGDRGPYATKLLLRTCQQIVALDAMRGVGHHLFVIEDKAFAQSFHSMFVNEGFLTTQGAPSNKTSLPLIYLAIRNRLSIFNYFFKSLLKIRALRKSIPLPVQRLRECDVLIVAWSGKATFFEDKPVSENRYLGRLPTILREAGYTVGYITQTVIDGTPACDALENSIRAHDPVILLEDCFGFGDLLKTSIASVRDLFRINIRGTLGDMSLQPTLQCERQREAENGRPMQSRLSYYVGKKLAQLGIIPKLVIHQYENQPWEKTLRLGLRENFPEVRIIGCQHVPLAPLFINSYPSHREIQQNLIPDHLLVVGEYYAKLFMQHGFPADKISVGGGLRFEVLIDNETSSDHQPRREIRQFLCCTSISFEETFELVHKVIEAAQDLRGVEFVVNFHPVLPASCRAKVEAFIDTANVSGKATVRHSDETVDELLPAADLVIYNTSSAALNALGVGCPALSVLRDFNLDYDRVPEELAYRARSIDEISAFFVDFMNDTISPLPFDKFSQAIAPVDETALLSAIAGKL